MVEWPVCFKKSSILFIEEHAAACSSKFNVLFEVNSADEIEDGKKDISDVTSSHGEEDEEENVIQEN